jgi:ACS family hexuronate transporter-like MFS transporter
MFPKKTIGSVIGIGGMAGGLGGMLIAKMAGLLFDHYKALGTIEIGYYIMFLVCGSAYLLAWLVMHALTPKMKQVDL